MDIINEHERLSNITLRHKLSQGLNREGQQFHQISTKQTTTSHLKSLNTKNIMTYGVGNPGNGIGQA
jgi:hypothetical protein